MAKEPYRNAKQRALLKTALTKKRYVDEFRSKLRPLPKGGPSWRGVDEGRRANCGSGSEFLLQVGHLLVREEHSEQIRVILDKMGLLADEDRTEEQGAPEQRGQYDERGNAGRPRPGEPIGAAVIAGLRLVRLEGVADGQATLDALKIIRDGGAFRGEWIRGLGPGAAAPNHVVHICGDAGGCPATEPEPVPLISAPHPGPAVDRCAGEGVRIVVVDTGFDKSAAERSPWLASVDGEPDENIKENGTLEEYAGHGTFIAGVIRSVAPRSEVYVRSVFNFGGGVLEDDLIATLDRVLECDDPDIISMSAGTYAYDASGMLAFAVFNERRLSRHKGVALVTAAGNEGIRQPFWPAAAPYAVSVGALDTHWRGRASFSNHGGWVDVYAPGQDLINAFPVGTYEYRELEEEREAAGRREPFRGMARWSGTSFSTPVVAALIAARMSRTGENGRDAAAALIAQGRTQARPGVGAVLLPEG
jgi:subtilisin family serine protease